MLNGSLKKKLTLPKIIVHLRATSPLVLSKDIDMAIEKFIKNKKCDSLKTVNITKHNPYKMWKIDPKGYLKPILRLKELKEPWNEPRQKLPKIVFQNAQIDIFKTALIYKILQYHSKKLFLIFRKLYRYR